MKVTEKVQFDIVLEKDEASMIESKLPDGETLSSAIRKAVFSLAEVSLHPTNDGDQKYPDAF